jgi:hypothetical protein
MVPLWETYKSSSCTKLFLSKFCVDASEFVPEAAPCRQQDLAARRDVIACCGRSLSAEAACTAPCLVASISITTSGTTTAKASCKTTDFVHRSIPLWLCSFLQPSPSSVLNITNPNLLPTVRRLPTIGTSHVLVQEEKYGEKRVRAGGRIL